MNPSYRWFDPPAVLANQAFAHALAHEQAQADPRYAGPDRLGGLRLLLSGPAPRWRPPRTGDTMRTPGVMDVFRVPKPGAAIYQSQVDPAVRAVIVPVFCWDNRTPPGRADAMFATNCDRLEIYAGGTHLATAYPDTRRFGHLAAPPVFADLTIARRPAGPAGGRLHRDERSPPRC